MSNATEAALVKRPVVQLIKESASEFAKRLPATTDPQRWTLQLATLIQKNTDLLNCDPGSLLLAAYEAAELGVSLSPTLQLGYIIPYGGKAQFQISWRGLVQRAYQTGCVRAFYAEVVYERDKFERQYAPKRNLFHAPAEGDRGFFTPAGVLTDESSEIFVGENPGENTNIASYNVQYLASIQTANFGHNFIDANAAMTISGCEAGLTISDYYAKLNNLPQKILSIAELVANNLGRGVYAYDVGLYFGVKDAQHDPWTSGMDASGHARKAPEVLPMYMIPAGAPGNKPGPLACRANAGHCLKN